jgi:photosystem II stability/assembly factor-like uncharacterized protein
VITALAAVQDTERGTLIFAGSATGLRRSHDGGQTWVALSNGTSLPLITALAPTPSFVVDSTLFIGTAEGCYRTTDGGRTSQPVLTGGYVFAVAAVFPGASVQDTPSIVFAGTEADGVFRSDDGGQTWGTANAGLLDLTILSIAFSPDFELDRTGFVATASGLYATRNGGKAWRSVDLGLDEPAIQCLAISPRFGTDGLIFAGTEDDGLLRSDDAGATWEGVTGVESRSVTAVAFSSGAPRIAVATDQGVMVTTDAGLTWSRRGEEFGPVLCLTFAVCEESEALIIGLVGEGLARSENLGADWVRVDKPLSRQADDPEDRHSRH